MAFFITIEGADGVGKTTIAKKLAEVSGAVYFKTPSSPFSNMDVRTEVDREGSLLTSYFYYRASVQHASDQIKKLLADGKSVVCDRYIKTTQVYRQIINPEIENIFEETNLIKPDIEFLLTASSEVRQKRMQERTAQYGEANERDIEFQNKVQEKYQSLAMVEIDTSNICIDEVVEKIMSAINKI